MSKKYGGFTRAEIEEQASHSTSAGSNKNFLFLKNPDGALSNTCVKIAWGFSYGSLKDEHGVAEEIPKLHNIGRFENPQASRARGSARQLQYKGTIPRYEV